MLQQCLNFLFPENCSFCKRLPVSNRFALCATCFKRLPPRVFQHPQDGLLAQWFSWGSYQGPLGVLMQRVKYKPDLSLMSSMATLLMKTIHPLDIDVVVPVPSAPSRIYQRGFNPALMLAKSYSEHFNVPYQDVLKRDDPSSQALKKREERQFARRLFSIGPVFPPLRVLLIDDVRTTGSTLRGCASLLRSVGAISVTGLVIASCKKKYESNQQMIRL